MKKELILFTLILFCFTGWTSAQQIKPNINSFSQSPKAKPKALKWQTYFNGLKLKHHGNKESITKEISDLEVSFKTKKIVVSGANGVAGVFINELLNELTPVDKKLFQMGIEDMMELGGIKNSETLLACMGSGGMAGGQHVTDLEGIDLTGGGILSVSNPGNSGGGINYLKDRDRNIYAALNNSQITMATNACQTAQINNLMGGFGLANPKSPAYAGAVKAAKDKMESSLSNCDGGINPIASGENTSSNSNTSENQNDETSIDQALVTVVGATATTVGIAAEVLDTKPISGFSAVGMATDVLCKGYGLATANGDGGYAGAGCDAVGAILSGGTLLEGAALGAGAATGLATLGVGAAAVGLVATAYIYGRSSANAMSSTYAKWADAQWQKKYGDNAQSTFQPGEVGKATCESTRQAWYNFSAYCDEAGWDSYVCARFVAVVNGCADPALVNPGPEGYYVCSAKTPADMKKACENACEAKKRISQPGNNSREDCGCKGLFDRADFNMQMQKKICETSQGGGAGDEISSPCKKMKFGNGMQITPGVANPTSPVQTPAKTIDGKLNVAPGKPIAPAIVDPKAPVKPNQKGSEK